MAVAQMGECSISKSRSLSLNVAFLTPVVGELLPDEKIHPELFKGSNRKFSKPKSSLLAANRNDALKTPAQEKRRLKRLTRKQAKLYSKLQELGIEVSETVKVSQSQSQNHFILL
jgi:hypothetical protein